MVHSTASSVRAHNTVEETFPLTQRPSASANQPRTSIEDSKPPKKPLNWPTKFRRAIALMVHPKKPIGKAPTVWRSIQAIVFASCEIACLQPMDCVDIVF
jgi:hypothetical protein